MLMKFSKSIKDDVYYFLVGFFMGSANVIPGVSGGTMLFIMGAFGKLVHALKTLGSPATLKLLLKGDFKALKERIEWRFLLMIILGMLAAFASLAKLIVYMLNEHTQLTRSFFFGLIAASIITVNHQMKKWDVRSFISLPVAAVAAFGVISLVPVNTGDAWYTMIFCGAISVIAMILPGLSGSFLLLILGQYDRVWTAVSNVAHFKFSSSEILMLIFLALGCVIGLGCFVHALNYLMEKHSNVTVAALIGFMVGSLPKIWPFQHDDLTSVTLQKGKLVATRVVYEMPGFTINGFYVLLCALAGLFLVLSIEFYAKRQQQKQQTEQE